jgi:hypothetical protein
MTPNNAGKARVWKSLKGKCVCVCVCEEHQLLMRKDNDLITFPAIYFYISCSSARAHSFSFMCATLYLCLCEAHKQTNNNKKDLSIKKDNHKNFVLQPLEKRKDDSAGLRAGAMASRMEEREQRVCVCARTGF